MKGEPAIVLLSGGLDSATCLAIAFEQSFDPIALTFDYGQRHAVELSAAKKVASHFNVSKHVLIHLDFRAYGASALTSDIPVPKDGLVEGEIPVTYVPARNTIFLAHALALAEASSAHHIFIGVNALDYSGYPDCRPEFVAAFEAMANLATRESVQHGNTLKIQTPLLHLTKAEIVQEAIRLGVPICETISCYDPDDTGCPCGMCDACRLRQKGLEEAGFFLKGQ